MSFIRDIRNKKNNNKNSNKIDNNKNPLDDYSMYNFNDVLNDIYHCKMVKILNSLYLG